MMDGAQDLNSPTMPGTLMENCTHSAYHIASAHMVDKLNLTTSTQMSPGSNLAITFSKYYLAHPESPSQPAGVPHPTPSDLSSA